LLTTLQAQSKNQNFTAMSNLPHLPRELLQEIAYHLDDAGLNTLCRTNRQVYDFLNLYLYRRDMTNKSDQQGRSLCWGARKGVKATVQWAIAAGRQQQHLGSPLPECYRHALNIAVGNGNVHLVKLLLEVNGMDVTANVIYPSSDNSALHLACQRGDVQYIYRQTTSR
jgi:ankyrin repeat protein